MFNIEMDFGKSTQELKNIAYKNKNILYNRYSNLNNQVLF